MIQIKFVERYHRYLLGSVDRTFKYCFKVFRKQTVLCLLGGEGVDESTFIVRRADIPWRRIGDNVLAVAPNGKSVLLKGIAANLWEKLDGASLLTLFEEIVQQYHISARQAMRDLERFLQQLQKNGLIHIDNEDEGGQFEVVTESASQDTLLEIARQLEIPLKVYFNVTFQCNLRCIHCYAADGMQSAKAEKELTTEEIYKILEELAQAGCFYITFTGGEPLCRSDLSSILIYARKLGFSVRLNTNATLLTKTMVQSIREIQTIKVLVSLYGACANTHDRVTRTPGSYERTLEGIKMLRKEKIPVTIAFLVMRQNYKEAPKVFSIAQEMGCNISFNPFVMPDFFSGKVPPVRLNEEELKEFLSMGLYRPKKMKCNIGYTCVIGYNGDVYPCLARPVTVGNLREQSFKEIWRSNTLRAFRKNPDYSPPAVCRSCRFFHHCHRCPAVALLEDGSLQAPMSMACRLMQAYEAAEKEDKQ